MYSLDTNQKLHSSPVSKTRAEKLRPRQSLIDRQIIITGIGGEIDKVVTAVNHKFGKERPKLYIGEPEPIEYEIKIKEFDDPEKNTIALNGMEIRRYDLVVMKTLDRGSGPREFRREETEEDIWKAIREVYRQAEQLGFIVFADPNSIAIGSTNGGSGSVGGGPGGPPGGEPDEDDYWNHWCFRTSNEKGVGINLEDDWIYHAPEKLPVEKISEKIRRLVDETGQGVDVIIFDTIPVKALNHLEGELTPELPLLKCGISSSSSDVSFEHDKHLSDVSAHGVYVGSLLHRIAPGASIYLNEVLDNRGRSDLFSLLKALHQIVKNKGEYGFENLIINLSLGVGISEDAMIEQQARDAMWRLFEEAGNFPREDNSFQHRLELLRDMVRNFHYIPSLRMMIQELCNAGVVIVAAAGNDSGEREGHKPSQIPAHYPEIIGVAASKKNGNISCFSNYGDVKAPGGNADESYCQITDLNEKWDDGKYSAQDFSEFALVGWTPRAYFPEREAKKSGNIVMVAKQTDFAYWRGTSFSTALVSGLAALVIQKMGPTSPSDRASKVKEFIQNGLGERGVINVKRTLEGVKKDAPVASES